MQYHPRTGKGAMLDLMLTNPSHDLHIIDIRKSREADAN